MNKQKRLGADISHDSLPYSVRVVQKVSHQYSANIWDTLANLSDVEEALFAMQIAEEGDEVNLHLNCNGGSMYVGDAILMGMRNCKAPIHVIATGTVASFATFILLNADSFEISPYLEILCHSASFGSVGKMQDTKEHVDFTFKQCKKFLHEEYKHFFTPSEIDDMIENKREVYMDTEEFLERYQKRNEAYLAEQQGDNSCEDHEAEQYNHLPLAQSMGYSE